MMLNMMTPEMMRMSMNFAKANPELVRQQMGGGVPGGAPAAQPSFASEEAKQASSSGTEQINSSSSATGAPPATDPSMPPDMAAMANNPMVKEMMNNPEMMKMAMNMMNGGNGQGGGMPDPAAMQNLMGNPSMQNMLSNPEMLTQSINMMKSNPAMLDMLRKQIPGVEPETLVRGLEWLSTLARYYANARSFCSSKLV